MNVLKDFSINKKKNSWLKFFIGLILIFLVVISLNIFILPIRNYFYNLSYPLQKQFWTAGESSSFFVASIFNAGSISKENENLKQENQKLISRLAFLQSVEDGNRAQSDVSLSCQNMNFDLVMAGVVGLDDDDILSINKGFADGIQEGMPVINQQNVLYGKVLKVYKNFSQVALISNKNSVVNVKVQGNSDEQTEVDGVVKGKGGLSAYLDLVLVDNHINPYDILVTSSLDKLFPKDLLVGKIIQKEKNDQKPFQQAEISLFFNVKAADNLFVIKNYKQAQ